MENDLPKGWSDSTVGNLSNNVQYGYTASAKDGFDGIRFLRITDIQDNKVDWDKVPICDIKDQQYSKFELFVNDIVFARTGATVGKSFLIDELPYKSVFASYLIRLSVYENIEIKYVKYFFESHNYWTQISDNSSGIGQPSVNASKLKDIQIPLPPLAEQKRIVAKLDTLFASLENTKTRLVKIPQLIKNFKQAVLTQAVTGKLTEQWREGKELEEWKQEPLGDVGTWKGGGTPSKSNKSFWTNGDVLWITPKDMKALFLSDSMDKITSESVKGSSANFIDSNSILIVTRSGILRRILPISMNIVRTTVNQDIKALTPSDNFNSKFLLYILRGLEENIRTTCMKSGTTVESVEFSLLKQYLIRYPSLKEQAEIVRRVESLFAKADAIEQQYNKLKQKIDTLPQALLAKAFRGGLVAQNPLDEPASVLLEKIKTEKDKLATKPKRKNNHI